MITASATEPVTESDSRALSALLELLVKLDRCTTAPQAYATAVSEVRSHLDAQTVVVGFSEKAGGSCVVRAISGIPDHKRDAELVRCVESALDEGTIRNALTVWPPLHASQRHSTLAHQRLCQLAGCKAIVTVPLRDDQGRAIGAILVLLPFELEDEPESVSFLRACEMSLGACLWRWKQHDRSGLVRFKESVRNRLRRGTIVAGVLCLLAAAAAFPVQHRLSCDCTVQPTMRRFVAAPFDGKLEQALVAPGDIVSAGQVLARMDGGELRLELASLTAELNRASKQSDAALATHNIAAAQQSQLERDRFKLKIELLSKRMSLLEIKSPLDGVIVSGDLRKAEGAPLAVGQTLFEVAPLSQMVVEVSIPEDDIAYASAGANTKIWLDACAGEPQTGTLARIHPRAEVRDQRSVFVAELPLANHDLSFRPGMHGRARIDGPRASLAWSWLHKPWYQLMVAMGW